MRKRTVFISFFTSCTQPCPSDLSAHTHPVCARALAMSDVYAREITSGAFRRRLTPHSHGASASTPLVDFEWSDVKRCRTELWVRRVASLALLAAEVENFSTFQAPTVASANQIASCKYPIPFMQHQRSM